MANEPSTCDSRQLQHLLQDELSEVETHVLTEHIEKCSTCRIELEELAAEKSLWQETGRQLRGGEWNNDGSLTLSLRDSDETADFIASPSLFSLGFLEPSENPALLGRLGEYEVIEVLGSGGFGIVLKAFDRELNRHVAIKVLAPNLANSAAARKRFSREAQAAAAVVHPNVVAIHTVDARGNLPYLVMPYIPGESLQQRLDRQGCLEIKEVLRIGLQTAQGLAAAHAQGLVHRDIKPANILLEHGVDRVMLTDFGLARAMDDASLTRSTIIAGTPQYMSPEQTRGESIDHRTDLFSLGSVLYAMCVGHAPFRAETMVGILRRVNEETPRPIRESNPDIPGWMCTIVERLLVKDPNGRFQSAAEVAGTLEQCLAHVQQPTLTPLPTIVATKEPSRGLWKGLAPQAAVIAIYVLLGIGLLLLFWPGLGDEAQNKTSLKGQQLVAEKGDGIPAVRAPDTSEANPSSEGTVWQDGLRNELGSIDQQLDWLEASMR